MAEHSSVLDAEKEVKKLKRVLEVLPKLVIPLNYILLWEKPIYLGIMLGINTVGFLFFWYMDPSFLTVISIIGLLFVTIDFLWMWGPLFCPYSCFDLQRVEWTADEERRLEILCKTLVANKNLIHKSINSIWIMKTDRPLVYIVLVVTTLLLLSWLGNTVNNVFLTYLLVNALILMPGIQHHRLINKYLSSAYRQMSIMFGRVAERKEKKT